jgi:outer membrane biosynthesis protein TonB
MSISEAPADVNEPNPPNQEKPGSEQGTPAAAQESSATTAQALRGNRWVDYDTHELLEMISELEDERRWARLREGVLWAILLHVGIIAALFLLPKYVFKVTPVVDKSSTIDKDEFTYMDTPRFRPKIAPKPAFKPPAIDKQTMDEMRKRAAQVPQPQPPVQQQQPQVPAPVKPQPTQPVPNIQQSQTEAPRPADVPARPNFAMNSANPADQLQQAMRNAARSHGSGETGNFGSGGGLAMHPGAGDGGVQVLSDTQGVDFSNWLQRWHWETQHTWDPLIPDEVNPPINRAGMVAIEFKVLPNGRLMPDSVHLVGRSGDTALDRAAWGALTGSNYPPLPREFHGPYLELRAYFLYNVDPPH